MREAPSSSPVGVEDREAISTDLGCREFLPGASSIDGSIRPMEFPEFREIPKLSKNTAASMYRMIIQYYEYI